MWLWFNQIFWHINKIIWNKFHCNNWQWAKNFGHWNQPFTCWMKTWLPIQTKSVFFFFFLMNFLSYIGLIFPQWIIYVIHEWFSCINYPSHEYCTGCLHCRFTARRPWVESHGGPVEFACSLPVSLGAQVSPTVIKMFTGLISCNYHQTLHSRVRMLRRGQ